MSARAELAKRANTVIRPLRFQIVAGTSTDPAVQNFISARKTIAAARKEGLSVTAYIDKHNAEPGATEAAVQAMIKIAGLKPPCGTVCEVGPGTGRYAREVVEALHPTAYEVYETAADWLPTLRQLPGAVIKPADGRTLAATPDQSVDLVHAHKVYVYLEFFAIVGYLEEMARVVRPGGIVAFDCVTEPCLDKRTVETWMKWGTIYRPVPREWVLDFLRERGLELLGSHFTPLPPGRSELLVFRRS
jgi:SAM-dependent methyltransferase